MLEKEAIQQRGFRNIAENGVISGYRFRLRSLYYRGLWLSQITKFSLKTDGEPVSNDDVTCTVNGKAYTIAEMKTNGDTHWNVLEPMVITVKKPGGLVSGAHTLEVDVLHSSSYMPPDMDFVLSTRGQKRELVLV
jgi:nicotinate-nucleotide pyrophosphorylase